MNEMTVSRIPAHHTAKTLLGTFAWLNEDPDGRRVLPDVWAATEMDLEQFRRWFLDRLHEKINREEPGPRGRKDCPDWYWSAWQLSRQVNTPRLIVRWASVEFRARLAHRLTTPEDEG